MCECERMHGHVCACACVCACMRSRLYVCVLVECAYVCFAVLHREVTFSRHYEHHRPSIAAAVGH